MKHRLSRFTASVGSFEKVFASLYLYTGVGLIFAAQDSVSSPGSTQQIRHIPHTLQHLQSTIKIVATKVIGICKYPVC